MARIEFHFNAPDKLGYACRLLRKVHANKVRAGVIGTTSFLTQLDQMLWTFSALDFIPHVRLPAPAQAAGASAVLLAESVAATGTVDVLVNCGEQVPEGFEQYARVIEIVTQDDADRLAARLRWKRYAQQGHELVRHDLATAKS